MKNTNTETAMATYAERIEPDKRLAKTRHVQDAVRHIQNSHDKMLEMGAAGVDSVEELRLAGVSWLAGSDKNQYDLYFYNFAETLVKPEDAKILTREVVKVAIHFATVIEKPVEDLQTAMPFLQKVAIAFSETKANRRGIENAHIPKSPMVEFEGIARTACAALRKLTEGKAVEQMDESELDVIIKEWEPVYELVEKAKRLRLKTVNV